MGIVRALARLFLVLGIVYAILIVALPAGEYRTRVEVDRPVSHTWSVFMDASLAPEWMTGLVSMETIEGEPGRVGSRHRLVFEEGGARIELEEEVTRLVEGEELGLHLTSDILESDVLVRFEDLGDGRTAIVSTSRYEGKGLFKPLVAMSESRMRQHQQEMVERLGALAEAR